MYIIDSVSVLKTTYRDVKICPSIPSVYKRFTENVCDNFLIHTWRIQDSHASYKTDVCHTNKGESIHNPRTFY